MKVNPTGDIFNADLLKFPPGWWQRKGMDIYSMIKMDADKGMMQDGQSGIQYRSRQYKEYKARFGQRKTTDTKGNKPHKIKPVYGVQVTSNETAFVNMQLTGRLFRGLQSGIQALANNLGVRLSYSQADADKIFGAEDLGRDIVGLNEVNIEKVFQDVLAIIDTNIKEQWEESIKIVIS
jgi:hypothetical protein